MREGPVPPTQDVPPLKYHRSAHPICVPRSLQTKHTSFKYCSIFILLTAPPHQGQYTTNLYGWGTKTYPEDGHGLQYYIRSALWCCLLFLEWLRGDKSVKLSGGENHFFSQKNPFLLYDGIESGFCVSSINKLFLGPPTSNFRPGFPNNLSS